MVPTDGLHGQKVAEVGEVCDQADLVAGDLAVVEDLAVGDSVANGNAFPSK